MPTILLSSWMGRPNCVVEEKKEGHGCATRLIDAQVLGYKRLSAA